VTLFNSLFDLTRDSLPFANGMTRAFLPPADLIVTADAVTVTMDVPGLNAESLEIELNGEILTVRGERHHPQFDGTNAKWARFERGYGKFQRTLQVPKGLDPDTVSATISDGVLTINLPLPEAHKPRRIQITGATQQPAIEASGKWEDFSTSAEPVAEEEPALVGAAS
jgi:HSP20 family protein